MNEPQRLSALHDRHLASDGHMESISGWPMPVRYRQDAAAELEQVRAAAGISDASGLTKLDLRGDAGELPVVRPARLWRLTATRALLTSPQPIAFAPSASVTDVTSIFSAILLAGPASRQVLHKLTTLNVRDGAMADGAARKTRIAHVNATILRTDGEGVPGFLILNTRDVAEHMWDSLLHAGHEFGLAPFGTAAQRPWLGAL